jgi:hypothetical protein
MKILVYSLLLAISFQFALFAQPMKMRERLLTVKKVKLVEYMKLPDEKANKLLNIVTKYDNKLDELNEKVRVLSENLEEDINNLSDEELKKRNNEIVEKLTQISEAHTNRLNETRKILTEKEFARFQVFEYKFALELRKHLLKDRKNRRN